MPAAAHIVGRKPGFLPVPHIHEAFQEVDALLQSGVVALQRLKPIDAFLQPSNLLPEFPYLAHDHRFIMMIAYTAATRITNDTPSAVIAME
jgi:hypothetical protein